MEYLKLPFAQSKFKFNSLFIDWESIKKVFIYFYFANKYDPINCGKMSFLLLQSIYHTLVNVYVDLLEFTRIAGTS